MKRTPRQPEPELFYELRLVDEGRSHAMPLVRSKSRLEVLNLFCDFDGSEAARIAHKPLYVGDGLRVEMLAIVGTHEIILSEQDVDEMQAIDDRNAGTPSVAVA